MNVTASARTIGLLIVLFGLAGGIAHEVLDWRSGPDASPAAAKDSGVPPAAKSAALPAPNRLIAWRDEILARPLFSPTRRPVEHVAQTLSGLSRLTGIISSGTRRIAIFAGQSGGHAIIAEEGARIGAYDVRAISDSGVTVAGPEGTTVIRPLFDAARPAGPTGPRPLLTARPVTASGKQ